MKSMKQRLKQVLSERQKQSIVAAGRAPSAVLLPIYLKEGQPYVLLTKRTQKVKHHKGEVSFPGGAYQKGDKSLVNTALRETAEETGLMADDVEILGELDDTTTRTSNYIISTFVAFIPYPYRFELNRDEAEEIIEVPVSALRDKSRWYKETEFIDNKAVTYYYYHYSGEIIHGATAKILNQFLGIIAPIMDSESLSGV